MRDKLGALPGIQSAEKPIVPILLTQSVFLGIFLGAFDICAHSLFLSVFDEKMMAWSYVISGVVCIILTSLYSWVNKNNKFRNQAIINLMTVTALAVLLWSGNILYTQKWMIFLLFIMVGPLNILALLCFRETAVCLTSLKQQRRLYTVIDSGLIIGILIISFAVPCLLLINFKLQNILLVSALSVFMAAIIQINIRTKFNLTFQDSNQNSEKPETIKSLLRGFGKIRFIRIWGILAMISLLSAIVIQYLFMAVTREQYPDAEDMATFLGLFIGGMMVFIIIIKQFLFKYILSKYSFRTCVLISPVLISSLAAITLAIGLFMGYTPSSIPGFLIFFILLALSSLISISLRVSLESPSSDVISLSVYGKNKSGLRPVITFTLYGIGVILSGLLLAAIGMFSFIELIHFTLLLFLVVLLWIFVAQKLYGEYRKVIRKTLEGEDKVFSEGRLLNKPDIFKNRFAAEIAFRKDYFSLISGNYSVLDNTGNKWYFEKMIDRALSEMDISLLPALKRTSINSGIGGEIRARAADAASILEKKSASGKSGSEKNSGAKKVLAGTRKPQATEILRLFRDNSIESKRLALFMIGRFRISDLLSEVCEGLNISGLETDAYEVLKTFGVDAHDQLVRFYLVNSGNTSLSKQILRLLVISSSEETSGFLFSRLWSNSRQLKEVALKCLIDSKFKPSDEEKERLRRLTSEVTGLITWDLFAMISLKRSNNIFLAGEMGKEISRWSEFLINILSVTYNSGSIYRIIDLIKSGTLDGLGNAFEMIDSLIKGPIKQKLISVFEDVPDEIRLKNMQEFNRVEISGQDKLLEDIINRDYNLISLWTKACTLRSIFEVEGDDMAESVAALMFSPEQIVQEESAMLIMRTSHELYKSVSQRLSLSTRMRMDSIISGATDEKELLFNKVLFLSKCFEGIPEEELLMLAGEMKYAKNTGDVDAGVSESAIIWVLSGENDLIKIHIFYEGESTDVLLRKYRDMNNFSFYILPLSSVEEFHFHFPEKSVEILKYVDIYEEMQTVNLLTNQGSK